MEHRERTRSVDLEADDTLSEARRLELRHLLPNAADRERSERVVHAQRTQRHCGGLLGELGRECGDGRVTLRAIS